MPSPERLRELSEAAEPRMALVEPFFLLPGPDVTELLLIRHAQVPEGSTVEDDPLTAVGREQAETLADFLALTRIDAVYASPAARAQATAAPLAQRAGVEVGVVDDLRDVDNRLPRGLSMQEALVHEFGETEGAERYEKLLDGLNFDAFGHLMESSAALRGRVAAAMDSLIAAHAGGRIAVVSHGPTIAAYISEVLRNPRDFVFYPRLTSLTVVLAKGERRELLSLNEMPHFGVI
jgi:probable phosphoglycerate mutase